MATTGNSAPHALPFRRLEQAAETRYEYIGDGDFGGKALGLAFLDTLLREQFDASEFPSIKVSIPKLVVLRTSLFQQFVKFNNLSELLADPPSDDRIGRAFQRATFPGKHTGDLLALANSLTGPLAVRSSSRLEDAMFQPFAGVYATKMIPNNQGEATSRFHKLIEAIKFVWASTWFKEARQYQEKAGVDPSEEAMAVIIQEVAGDRHNSRFYPSVSGVGRSFNYYAFGRAKPEHGVVDLAVGLGKTIVDGGQVWTYSPAFPKLPPPVNSTSDLLKSTQTRFWAVNLGNIPSYDPLREVEYLTHGELSDAEEDGTLVHTASTYDARSDKLIPGTGREGPRVLDFGPLLQYNTWPVNALVRRLLALCEAELGLEVEIEFAVTLPKKSSGTAHFHFLQVRPMVAFEEHIDLPEDVFDRDDTLLTSDRVLGNGERHDLTDILYLKPEVFETAATPLIVQELEQLNRELIQAKRSCVLIGFGRWGSSDPWLGVPVVWSQISEAAVIVEVTTPKMDVDLSQGSHFFHNLSAFRVTYFSVRHNSRHTINYDWLDRLPVVRETAHVKHVRASTPLTVMVDGRTARGAIFHD